MTQKLLDALAKLDPKNDNHWTAEGAPRVETLRILASDSTLTRDDINKAANDFTRDTATASAASALAAANPAPAATETKAAVQAPAAPTPVAQPIAQLAKEEPAPLAMEDTVSASGDELAAVESKLERLYQARHDIEALIDEAQRESDYLIARRDSESGKQTEEMRSQEAIQGYLASQIKQREAHAAVLEKNPPARSAVSPIDQALAGRGRAQHR